MDLVTGKKRDSFLEWLNNKLEDILVLQETHSTLDTESSWLRAWDGPIHFNHGTSTARGTAILIKRKAQHVKFLNHVILEPCDTYKL